MKKNNRLMYRNNRLFFVVVSVFYSFCFCCFISDVLRTIILFISSICLFVKTNRERCMLFLMFVWFYFFCKIVWVSKTLQVFAPIFFFIVCSDIMFKISIFVSVLTKYQKFCVLLKIMLCMNCLRFNQVQHKHQGFIFIKQGEIIEPSGVQALKNPKPFEGC